jgi:hypothetical protein
MNSALKATNKPNVIAGADPIHLFCPVADTRDCRKQSADTLPDVVGVALQADLLD